MIQPRWSKLGSQMSPQSKLTMLVISCDCLPIILQKRLAAHLARLTFLTTQDLSMVENAHSGGKTQAIL